MEDGGSIQVNRNRLTNNYSSGNGEFYGFYIQTPQNLTVSSNLIANNVGLTSTYNLYSINWYSGNKSVYLQNTIYARPSTTSGHVGFGYYIEDESEVTFNGNILDMEGDPNSYGFPVNVFSSAKFTEVDYNTCYVKLFGSEYWGMGQNGYTDWGSWKSSGINGPNEYFGNPQWNSVSKLISNPIVLRTRIMCLRLRVCLRILQAQQEMQFVAIAVLSRILWIWLR